MKTLYLNRIILTAAVFLFCSIGLAAQTLTVKGKVTDSQNGEELIGVSVVEKGTSNGTVTDFNGNYSLTVKKNAKLIFSYVGYKNMEKKVNGEICHVALNPDDQQLDECIVLGYGSVNKDRSRDYRSAPKYAEAAAAPFASYYYGTSGPSYDIDYKQANTEEYGGFTENKFKSAADEPLSTLSADVDVASYSNMRRFLNQGQLPPKDAIRTEELINYFSYVYPQPKGEDPVSISTEVGECPWNTKHRLVRVGLKAKEIADDKLPASNFVFLIDVSGSMYGPTRLDLVKSSLRLLTNNLREKDKVSIVVYAGAAGVVLPATSGNDKQKIREALDKLTAGGSTAGGAGIQLAYKIAKENLIKGGNNRIILCTDGDFNVGVSSNEGLENMIEIERQSGVFLTVLGYGMGNYKDNKMQILAQKGNGNHAYIDNMQEANKVLVNEFGGTMYTVAKDVKLQLEFNPAKVFAYRLIGYETRLLNKEDFNDDTKDAGEMGAGHTVTALYEIIPVGVKSNVYGNVDDLKYQKQPEKNKDVRLTDSPELLTVKMRYKQPDGNTSKKLETAVIDPNTNKVSDDFRFCAAVAMFGQLLRDSQFKGEGTYDKVVSLAEKGTGEDKEGYRREFIRLAQATKGLTY